MLTTSSRPSPPPRPDAAARRRPGPLALAALGLVLAAGPLAGCSSCGAPAEDPAGEAPAAAQPPAPRRAATEVELLAPTGAVTPGQPFNFRWQGPEGKTITGWIVTVMARPDAPLWTSRELAADELQAPPELLTRLEPGKLYTWRVTGRVEGGGRIRSESGRLAVTAGP